MSLLYLNKTFAPGGHYHFVHLWFPLYFQLNMAASLTTCGLLFSLFTVLPLPLSLPRSQRKVLTVRCHPSGLSSVAPGRLARTAWDSAHLPALIIPACSAGTSSCHPGLFRPSVPPFFPPFPLSLTCAPVFYLSHYCTPHGFRISSLHFTFTT